MPVSSPCRPTTSPVAEEGAHGIWYVVLIGAVLLIATAIYAAYLYQQVKEWRPAAEQLTIGQEMLRFDRDEILQKVREREVTLSTLEVAHEQDRSRLEGLEKHRRQLQASVLRLTQDLARSKRQTNGQADDSDRSEALQRLQRESDRLHRELETKRTDISELEAAAALAELKRVELVESLLAKDARIEEVRAQKADLEEARSVLEQDGLSLEQELAQRRQGERQRQIIRGHEASLGEVKPYITEVGPAEWSTIESWLALQLRRPMAVPDLSAHGWSYEGARLLGSSDGPPMAMLLYADAEERPASLTIIRDGTGERPLEARKEGGLNFLDWREERHAFFLVGEAGEEMLTSIAVELQNQPPWMSDDAVVPVSRYIRPARRPAGRP